jgi:hypothetical protein
MSNCTRARILAAGLLVSGLLGVGCDRRSPVRPTTSDPGPSITGAPVVRGVHPNTVAAVVPTLVTLFGERLDAAATVLIGGARARVVSGAGDNLTVLTPVHAPATVDIVITNPDGRSGRLAGAFVFEDSPAGVPSVERISPALGVTSGGTSVEVSGTGFRFGTTVTLDGVLMRTFLIDAGRIEFTTPPHASGAVDIVVSNRDGEARVPRAFTYAAPDTFDFNGVWKGQADGPPDSLIELSFNIVNNALVSVSCGTVTLSLSPGAPLRGGEFSYYVEQRLVLSGRMLSMKTAEGEIHLPPCSPSWYATK